MAFPSLIFSDFLCAGWLNRRSDALEKNVLHQIAENTKKKKTENMYFDGTHSKNILSQVDQICARNEFSPFCEQVWVGAGLENNVGLTPAL